ncbi:SMI1/KNR4 family protein [Jannaschia sp. LMIT008]|uniref:SMI1/KNR4 family protein n=1 Tax=Jannaschia maritima TaxID=3032585 RepID=UPI002811D1AD|nr:SMI1/KNR4 family protein [Jannaschia sp. LMIT008]
MTIEIDPRWSLHGRPADMPLTPGGALRIGGGSHGLPLPDDYLTFLGRHDGGILRRGRSWFVATFPNGQRRMQIDSLSDLATVAGRGAAVASRDGLDGAMPPNLVPIGFDEANEADILIRVDPGGADHGHVYVWIGPDDPWTQDGGVTGLGHVAPGFTAFLNGLREDDLSIQTDDGTMILDPHWTLNAPAASVDRLKRLPPDYAAFLARHDGGTLTGGPNWTLAEFPGGYRSVWVDVLHGIDRVMEARSRPMGPTGVSLFDMGFDLIGSDRDGTMDVYLRTDPTVSPEAFAQMRVPEPPIAHRGIVAQGIGLIAPSFSAFLNGLRDNPDR